MEDAEPAISVEVDLAAVATGDQELVRNVCAVLASVFRAGARPPPESISVSSNGRIYIVVAAFAPGAAVLEVAKADLDTVCDVNPLRVVSASVLHDGERPPVKVRVCGFDHPVTVTDTHIVRVVRKRRWGALW
jgi:hypothetical protein